MLPPDGCRLETDPYSPASKNYQFAISDTPRLYDSLPKLQDLKNTSLKPEQRPECMRKIRYTVATSLDGYIAGPNGEYD